MGERVREIRGSQLFELETSMLPPGVGRGRTLPPPRAPPNVELLSPRQYPFSSYSRP